MRPASRHGFGEVKKRNACRTDGRVPRARKIARSSSVAKTGDEDDGEETVPCRMLKTTTTTLRRLAVGVRVPRTAPTSSVTGSRSSGRSVGWDTVVHGSFSRRSDAAVQFSIALSQSAPLILCPVITRAHRRSRADPW